jgi:haloacid dehalogenase superfamily, subfamily IA, variant 3 with third motif having DD or ED/haloacid dehalogenase superfamily, subfamily IA, variant 1 with third motif having Dx(3-4)D or Dx(3-4)E
VAAGAWGHVRACRVAVRDGPRRPGAACRYRERGDPAAAGGFDIDGTLLDSANEIFSSMRAAFEGAGLPPPPAAAISQFVGLSLPLAIQRLAPEADAATRERLVEGYRACYVRLRAETGGEAAAPLFPGARAALARLDAAGWLMGVATGKSRRGLEHALDGHDLRRFFVATQTGDDAPSKPHPGMLLNLLAATGVSAEDAVYVGDTRFDVEAASAAGFRAIGVSWGHHSAEALTAAGAETVIEHFDDLDAVLEAGA